MAFFRDKPGCRPNCCGVGCIVCDDNFDRPNNADIASDAPRLCDWVQGGDSAFRIEGNSLFHPAGSESWATMPNPSVALDLDTDEESFGITSVSMTFSSLGNNDGDEVGLCNQTSNSRVAIRRNRGDSGQYNSLVLVQYDPTSPGGADDFITQISSVYHLFDAPVNGDITLCININSNNNQHSDITITSYTGERVTTPLGFLISLFSNIGVYAKGEVTIKSFTMTQSLENDPECVQCGYQCLKEIDDEFLDTPVPDYLHPIVNGVLSHEGDAWRATGTHTELTSPPSASLSFLTYTCFPEIGNFNKFVIEMTRGPAAQQPLDFRYSSQWSVFIQFGHLGPHLWFRVVKGENSNAWYFYSEYKGPPGSGFPVGMSMANAVSQDDDIYAIAISNPTQTDGEFVAEFLVNGNVLHPLTMTDVDFTLGPNTVDLHVYPRIVFGFSYTAIPDREMWAEIKRFRLFTT